MKVAILSPIEWRTPPRVYGSWQLIASNITEGLVKRGLDVTLFATGDSKTHAKLRFIAKHPTSHRKFEDRKVYEYLHSVLPFEHAEEFDIIHNHYNAYPLVFSSLVKTPIITTIHGFSSRQIVKIYKKYNHTHYVSISNADRRNAPHLNYIDTVYHGIDTKRFSPGGGGDHLVHIGRIAWQKGTHLVCEVAKRAGLPLKIAGFMPEEEKEYFRTKVQPYLGKQIHYLGEVSDAQKLRLLQNALCFVHFNDPRYMGEGFGLGMVEAQSCGTPVVARAGGPVKEVVRHGRTGFIANSMAGMVTAVKKIHTIRREACSEFVKNHFTIDRMVENYIRVYEKILTQQK